MMKSFQEMHSKSDNIEIMINDEADEVIKELFDSLKNRYQNNLQWIEGSDFVFDYVHLLYYKYHKVNLNRGRSYIDFTDRTKTKKQQEISSIKRQPMFSICCNSHIHHEEIKKDPQTITRIKFSINKYNWEGINVPSEKNNWKNL